VDKHTFETDELLVIYFDMNQNITIQGRLGVDPKEIDAMLLSVELGSPEGPMIEQGRVGDKYQLSTESGREYFGLSLSDIEAPSTPAEAGQ
jgi:hypothetical protein